MNIYINKSEIEAIQKAWEEVNEKLEGCNGDEMEEQSLQFTLKGLRSLEIKIKKKLSVVNGS